MILLKPINTKQFIAFLLADPALCYLGLPDEGMDQLYHKKTWKLEKGTKLLGVFLEDKLLCCIRYLPYTQISVLLHMYMKTQLHKSGFARIIQEELRDFFKKTTDIKKVFIMTPAPCVHIQTAVEGLGFKLEGHLIDCFIWRQQVVDLLIYGQSI